MVDFLDDPIKWIGEDLGVSIPGTARRTFETLYSEQNKGKLWTVKGEDWYKTFPYQFVVRHGVSFQQNFLSETKDPNNDSAGLYYYTLPIPPQQISKKPIFASRATATVGGVVEETSPVTFWMIHMTGTTGIGVSRADGDTQQRKEVANIFRDKITTTGLLSGIFAGANQAISKIGGVADQALAFKDAVTGDGNLLQKAGAAAKSVTGALNTVLTPPLPYSGSAVSQKSNGFTEMEELVKFFYMYSRLKSSSPSDFELFFVDYKTDQRWRVIIKDFNVQKHSQSPFLYRYNITLQAWDIRSSTEDPGLFPSLTRADYNRFGPDGDLSSVNSMEAKTMVEASQNIFKGNGVENTLSLLG